MLACKSFILLLVLAVLASARKGGRGGGGRGHSTCSNELSDGPEGATLEIRLGQLPASTPEQPVFLSWWAARESSIAYDPLQDPSKAEVRNSGCKAYAKPGELGFNGGKVQVTENGEATVRVLPPATYSKRHGGGKARAPHIHFNICGNGGRPKKIAFTESGAEVHGGCSSSSGKAVSYKVLSARNMKTGEVIESKQAQEPEKESEEQAQEPEKEFEEKEQKDWDALEFSPIYDCLTGVELFDQFSSNCSTECPAHADMAHGQCVRKQVSDGKLEMATLAASWRLRLDCNDKCWADSIPASRHMVRIALADHLDITFQEAEHVKLRKDPGSPTTHAHLKVRVITNRLEEDQGSSLLSSFIPNASMVADLLGLPVHEVTPHDNGDDDSQDSSLPGEVIDDYAEYYVPLADDAERHAQDSKRASIAGIDVPASVPVAVIIGAAAAVITVFSALAIWLHIRRKHSAQAVAKPVAKEGVAKVDNDEEMVGKVKEAQV